MGYPLTLISSLRPLIPHSAMLLIATSAFGLEAVVVRELTELGYSGRVVRPGRIAFEGDPQAVCRANLWLRSADRVLVELASFEATDFDVLFETTRTLAWESWIRVDAAMPVRGRSHKSQLSSVPAIQRTVKKAMVERLQARVSQELPETGPPIPVEISIVENRATVDLDASGDGLHRRGYRKLAAAAQLRETLAAALVELSFWKPGRPLVDPFCGTGTIAIEAALMGRQMAPGRRRSFTAEHWPTVGDRLWQSAREEADAAVRPALQERIIAYDCDAESLSLARYHAEQAGVADDIHFQQRAFDELSSQREYGCVIANPPYGQRMGRDDEVESLYRSMPAVFRRLPTWSHYVLTARSDFEQLVGQRADRRRKLYNGRIACTYYQFHGPRPPRRSSSTLAVAPPAFGGLLPEATRQVEEFANRLRKTARHLRRWPTRRQITCYRLYERDIPEIPFVVDRYGDALHISEFERPHGRTAAQHADWLDLMVGAAADALEVPRDQVFLKNRTRQRGAAQYERVATRKAVRVVEEGGLKFQVNLSDYVDTGLFLDHRLTRGLVRDEAAGARFLNLFGYTGSFTVYAAAGGAVETTTVDLSPVYLDWARENLRLNGFEGDQHHLVEADATEYLEGLGSDDQFDLVVVDPPTFSNSKRLDRDWQIQRDHGALLAKTIGYLAAGGKLYFSTNFRRFRLDEASLSGMAIREITKQTLPEDFRNKRIHRCWRLTKPALREQRL